MSIPSRYDINSHFGYLNIDNLSVPPGKMVQNDIRSVYDKLYSDNRGNSFGYNSFGFGYETDDSDDSEETSDDEDLEFGSSFGYETDDSDDDLEFGKRRSRSAAVRRNQANAKKAMKLAYSEGISLKEAWKRVKRGKSTTSRKTTRKSTKKTTRKRKTTKSSGRNQAARAMKLAHREGISLKQAWKRIKSRG